MNKEKNKTYILFSILSSVITLFLATTIMVLAFASDNRDKNYPSYSYSDYVDRSDNMVFTRSGGGQLYEAEVGSITGTGIVSPNIGASDNTCVENLSNYSAVSYTILSDSDIDVELILSINYQSEYSIPTDLDNLFTISVNQEEVVTNNISIISSASEYDFKENSLGVIKLNQGNNLLSLVSYNAHYKLDYFVLNPKEVRSGNLLTIGHDYLPFYGQGDKSRIEAESGEREGPVIFSSSLSSQGYHVLFSQAGDKLSFYIDTDREYETELAISIRGDSSSDINFNLTLNDEMTGHRLQVTSDSFAEYNLGSVLLSEGHNVLSIDNNSGVFFVDYLTFNSGINYSLTDDTQHYEAEEAFFTGSLISDEDAYSEEAVLLNRGDRLSLNIVSSAFDHNHLILRMKYQQASKLTSLLTLSLNGEDIHLNNLEFKGSDSYQEIFITRVNLNSGSNTLLVSSIADDLYLDSFIFTREMVNSDTFSQRYEAENAYLSSCSVEYNSSASSGRNVGYIQEGSTITFTILTSEDTDFFLRLAVSNYLSSNEPLSPYLAITINGEQLSLANKMMVATSSWTRFSPCEIGTIELKEGINSITVTCLASSTFNLDYLEIYSSDTK